MKKLLILAASLLLSGAAHADIVWQAEPPGNVPDKVPLVQVVPTAISRTTMLQRAAQLGFPRQGAFVKTPVGLALQSGPFVYQANPTGSEFIANTDLYFAGKPDMQPIPDDRAKSVAESYLKANFPRILAEGQVDRIRHLMNQAQDLDTGRLLSPTQDESIVVMRRALAGIPVVGPGDKADIHIANDGSITGVQTTWRRTNIIGILIGLLKYDQVRQAFLDQMAKEMGDGSVRVIVTRVQFGFYSRPENQPQGWYQPCYLFSVSFYDDKLKQETGARQIPVPAMDPGKLREPLEMPVDPPNNGDPGRIVVDVPRPTLPPAVPLVQVLPTRLSAGDLSERFQRLGGKPDKTEEKGHGLLLTDGTSNTVLYADDRGSEFYAHLDRFMAEKPGGAPPISDAESQKAAGDWLRRSGDMEPNQLGLPAVQHLYHQGLDLKTGKSNDPTQDETIVTFPRLVPAVKLQTPIPLVGQGTGVEVHVDNDGNVTGHRRVWRNIQVSDQMVELLPYMEAEGLFFRKLTPELRNSVAKVTDIKFGYFSRPEGQRQGWLLPAVLYEVDLIDPSTGEVTAHRQIPVPASANQPEDLEDPAAADLPPVEEDSREADTVPVLYGDIDGSGEVTTKDAALCLALFGGLDSAGDLPPAQMTAGDVAPAGAADGLIAMDDGLRILRSIFHLDDISNGP